MSINAGYLVKTKSGKEGRTYHRDKKIGGKTVVYVEVDGKELKMLCIPDSLEIIGYVD